MQIELESLPEESGIYRFYGATGEVIYVGKAKSLRRRLAQYRKPRRSKRHRRMKAMLKEAVRLDWEVAPSHFEACLREMRLIQTLKPRFNLVGTFTFLYPYVGIRREKERCTFCLSTTPTGFPDFQLYGAFRSRDMTGEAFFALMRILPYIGHQISRKGSGKEDKGRPRHSYLFHFRRLPADWVDLCDSFFRGQSKEALESLVLRLLENAGARAKAEDVQESFKALKRFFRHEAKPLNEAIAQSQYPHYPIPQEERDPLFLSFRMKEEEVK